MSAQFQEVEPTESPVTLVLGGDSAAAGERCCALGPSLRLEAEEAAELAAKILREAGLVASEQRGLWVYYYLRPQAVDKLRGLLGGLVGEQC
jgi:DNA-binding transcriptional ArsR family regulator